MREGLRVRAAVPGDGKLICELVQELATYEREPHAVVATPESFDIELHGPNPAFECIVVEVNSVPVGFALFFTTFSTWTGRRGAWLEDFYVKAEYRGQGAGRALFGELMRIAATRGYARLELEALDWNEPALAFYRNAGGREHRGWIGFRYSESEIRRLAEL